MAKYIIAVHPTIHLGIIKETFGSGSVIDHNEEEGRIVIDGRRFDTDRDMDVLIRQANSHPDNPWIVPYSEELLAKLRGLTKSNQEVQPGKAVRKMPVVQSDADSHDTIDISSTQVSKINMAQKEADREAVRNRDVNSDLPVIRGDETPAEVRDRQAKEGAMPVVRDDSLGYAGGKYDALNSGQPISGKTKDSEAGERARAIAEARKKDAERVRVASGVGEPPQVSMPVELPSENAQASNVISQQESIQAQEDAYPMTARVDALEKEVSGIRSDIGQIIELLRDGHPRVAVTDQPGA